MLLARGLSGREERHNIEVTVATATAQGTFDDSALPFRVERRPGLPRLCRLVREADVIHLAGPAVAPLFFSVMLRKQVIAEHHGYQAICPNGLLLYGPTKTACPDRFMSRQYLKCARCNSVESGWMRSFRLLLATWVRRQLCKSATVNMSVSQHVAQRLRLPRSTVMYYGVSDSGTAPETAGSGGTQSRSSLLTIGYLGRLVEEKGVPTLLEAVRHMRAENLPIMLKVIGDGPLRNGLEAAAGENGLRGNVTFTGMLQGEALREAANSLDLLVLPSVWEEPAALVIMEQLSRGRPLIVTDNGGSPELVGDAGLTFPPGDVAALVKCLRRFLDDPGLVTELGKRARQRAQTLFLDERTVIEHGEVFERLGSKNTEFRRS